MMAQQQKSSSSNVYLKMKKWSEAEQDCTDAIKLDPKNAKVAKKFDPISLLHDSVE